VRAVADLGQGLVLATVEPEVCTTNCLGWEAGFARLADLLGAETSGTPETED